MPAQLTLYTNDTCSDCRKLKNQLLEGYISFAEKNIDLDKGALETMLRGTQGKKVTPTAEIGGSFFPNPSLAQIIEALRTES